MCALHFFERFLFYLLIKLEVQYDSILVIGKVAVAVGYSVQDLYFIIDALDPSVVVRINKGMAYRT